MLEAAGLVTIFRAKDIITMDPRNPRAEAVAVQSGRIVGVGTFDDVRSTIKGVEHLVDDRFSTAVLIAGLIDQHLHPLLGASTLTTEVIAPEDWVMPERTFKSAANQQEYDERLGAASGRLDSGEWLYSWGYHELWHGQMSKARLDAICGDRPTAIWQRSCHEWFLNSAALSALGITEDTFSGRGAASEQLNIDTGHFWENGWMVLLAPRLMPVFLTEDRLREGLVQLVAYLHMNGVTAINEPGILWAVEPWNLYQEILGADEVPFSTSFLVDGRTQSVRKLDPSTVIEDANAQIARAPEGKVSLVPGQVKLFADGAIISQLMQMRDGYFDRDGNVDPDHHGEWIMEPADLRRYFDAYWDAGWQIHIHVNGDLGLDVLLDIIEDAMVRTPRIDHRTTVVHFANSTEDQVARIARLGAIVSANPYYPIGFADKYGEVGLGPARADVMVRSASVLRHSIPLSFHSDLPMGPSDPLAMAGFAVNRVTNSGRVAGPEQRIGIDDALRAVTVGAAFSWRREADLGSVEIGKLANFTVLADNPLEQQPADFARTRVLGSIFGGRWFPVPEAHQDARLAAANVAPVMRQDSPTAAGCGHGCGCDVAQVLAEYVPRRSTAA